jgi:hypothetical protein
MSSDSGTSWITRQRGGSSLIISPEIVLYSTNLPNFLVGNGWLWRLVVIIMTAVSSGVIRSRLIENHFATTSDHFATTSDLEELLSEELLEVARQVAPVVQY